MTNITIIDGHNYLYGAYYGVSDAAETSGGVRINAVYGFLALLRTIVNAYPKNKLFIVFDSRRWFKRKQKKETKPEKETSRDVAKQLKIIQKLLDKLNIKWIEPDTIKTDDIIASVATYWSNNYGRALISSGDFDFIQLLDDKISVARNLHGLITQYDKSYIREKFGIRPDQYIDYQAIVGDNNDNIIGVKGIGPKTTAKLLNTYDNVAGIFKNINQIPQSVAEKLKDKRNLILRNQKSIPMNRDIPISEIITGDLPDVDHNMVNKNPNELLAEIGIH